MNSRITSPRRLLLVTSTVAGLGAAMFVPGAIDPRANIFSTPAFANSLGEEAKNAPRGWLGVHLQSITAELAESMGLKATEGALIAQPQPNSPAAKAGLKAGDVITSIDGASIKEMPEVARKIAAMQPGSTVALGIIREGAEQSVTVTLGERQDARGLREVRANDEPRIGLVVAAVDSDVAGDQGVLVTGIDPKGNAAGQGFRIGDIILEVAGQAVKTPEDVRKALTEARNGQRKHVLMRVKSGEITKFMAVPLTRA